MKSFLYIVIILLFIACAAEKESNCVCYKKTCFEVELAKNEQEWTKGLQSRLQMDADKGMLFIFPEASRHKFWMKNTFIPLDIIWLDHSSRIVHIESNVQPCRDETCPTYGPDRAVNYVLEINAGMAEKSGMKIGERLDIYCKWE